MPPEAPDTDTGIAPPAASLCLKAMRKRAQFLAAARSRRHVAPTMLVQGRARQDGDGVVHVGFTCSKKLGNAVARNRAKRRLRAIAREVLRDRARPGWDYVLIGRPEATATHAFDELRRDLIAALSRLHA